MKGRIVYVVGILLVALAIGWHTTGVAQDSRYAICVEVEEIKLALRDEEHESYAQLRGNLKLLNLKPTPGIIQLASENHWEEIRSFAPHDCTDLSN